MSAQARINPRGFTLIELMIAITIVAVMATVGLAILSQVQKAGRDSKRTSDIEEVRKATETMKIVTGTYPTTLEAMASYFERGAAPTDPAGGAAYVYQNLGERYVICATIEACATNVSRCTNNGVTSSTTSVSTIGALGSTGATQLCIGN